MGHGVEILAKKTIMQPEALAYDLTALFDAWLLVVPPHGSWLTAHMDFEANKRTGVIIIEHQPVVYRCYIRGTYVDSSYDALEAASIMSEHVARRGWRRWLAERLLASHNRETAVQLAGRLECW